MERFQSIPDTDKDLVLRLGFACFDSASGLLNHDLQDEYEGRIQMMTSDYKAKINEMTIVHKQEIHELTSDHSVEIQRMRNERDTIVNDRVKTAVEAIRGERSAAVDAMCDTIRKDREHETNTIRSSMSDILAQMKELIREHRQTNEGNTKDMMGVIEALKGSSSNSAMRGRIGESTTELMLDEILPGCTWENTSGTGGKADFQVIVPDIGKILLDIKNHERSHGGVPIRDRKKLIRDLESDTDAVGAILVATQANIQSARHCQVIFTEDRKPVVCCLLEGNWDRLRDAIETLRGCTKFSNIQSGEFDNDDAIKSLRSILKCLCEQEDHILQSRQNIVRAMTEANIALSKIDPSWNPNLREWLMTQLHVIPDGQTIPKDQRVSLKDLKELSEIPKEAKGKTGRDNLRDNLNSLGITVNADGSLPNVRLFVNEGES